MSAGLISHDWAVAVSTLPETEHKIVAVSARNIENADKFAKEHNIDRAYGSYLELCQDPEIGEFFITLLSSRYGKKLLCTPTLKCPGKTSQYSQINNPCLIGRCRLHWHYSSRTFKIGKIGIGPWQTCPLREAFMHER